jgi:carbonic anhydrase
MYSYQRLLKENKDWAAGKLKVDPEYFDRLAHIQTPEFLWIGCSDSRVPANEITNTGSGEIFVHRNIANLVIHTDTNLLSVIEYAVKYLKVKHIIVCGHYNCGGVKASMTNNFHGFVDNWLRNIKDVYFKHKKELDAIKDMDKRADRLSELNVVEQVHNLAKSSLIQEAWAERELHLHGWIYGLNDGLIKDLSVIKNSQQDIDEIYRFDTGKKEVKEEKQEKAVKVAKRPKPVPARMVSKSKTRSKNAA